MKQLLFIEALKEMPGLPIHVEYQKMWAFPYFAARMFGFMAKHKDPFFEDERETRIIGVPATIARTVPFAGIAMVKKIETAPDGRNYRHRVGLASGTGAAPHNRRAAGG